MCISVAYLMLGGYIKNINKEYGMAGVESIEKSLDEVFVKNAPALPDDGISPEEREAGLALAEKF